jgi:hypothetical protein
VDYKEHLQLRAHGDTMGEIILDPSIRDWVVLPMIVLFVCSAMIRNYVSVLLKSEEVGELEEMRKM